MTCSDGSVPQGDSVQYDASNQSWTLTDNEGKSMVFTHVTRISSDRAYAAMRFDLRQLVVVEERTFDDTKNYTATDFVTEFTPSAGVTVTVGDANLIGWNATATHQALPGKACAVFGGSGPPVAPATKAGEVRCQ